VTKKKNPSELKRRGDIAGGYYTYAEAKVIVQGLGIRGIAAYREYTRQEGRDAKLPTDPARTYKDEFEGWPAFCGKTAHAGLSVDKYATFIEASEAAQRLGITDKADYEARHHLDPKLPAVPSRIYPDWPADKPWFKFLGKLVQYTTLAQASEWRSTQPARSSNMSITSR
jgi:hypothetical protein